MKRTLLTGIICVAAAVTSFAQGVVLFDNWSNGEYQITVGEGPLAGTGVNGTASLWWNAGTVALPAGFDHLVGWLPVPDSTTVSEGWVRQITATFPGYAGGPISFVMDATWAEGYGHSAAFTMVGGVTTLSAVQGGTPTSSLEGMQAFTVSGAAVVPEPTTAALAGLGLASLLIFRRRK